jgi:hypothetical protein
VNALAGQIARLNVEIANVKSAGGEPNDHLDERDRLLDRLAELSGAVSSIQENGEVLVSIGGHALVIGKTAFKLTVALDPANDDLAAITWEADGEPFKPARGELAGLFEARDATIPDQLKGLNTLAYHLADQVNTLRARIRLDGSTGTPPARLRLRWKFFASFLDPATLRPECQLCSRDPGRSGYPRGSGKDRRYYGQRLARRRQPGMDIAELKQAR